MMADIPGEIEHKEREGRDRRSRKSRTLSPNESVDSTPSTPRSQSGTPPPRLSRRSVDSTPSPSPSLSNLSLSRLPQRPGLFWRAGSKVEAKDFMGKWYPARITEVDEIAQEVHIHFEGWNSRYDEILSMESDRLRATVRHSERKERVTRTRGVARAAHKINECVFAKWTDCRLYAARILTVNSNGSYEVLFYDGFKKTVQPINVKTMSAEVQAEYQQAGILPPPIKKSKLKGLLPAGGRKGDGEGSEKEDSREVQSSDTEGVKKFKRERSERYNSAVEADEETPGPSKSKKRPPSDSSPLPNAPPKKKSKLLIGGIFKAKKKDKDLSKGADSPATSISEGEPRSPAKESSSSASSVKDESLTEVAPGFENPIGAPETENPTSAPASSTPQPDAMAEVGGARTLDACQSSVPGQSAPAKPVDPALLPVMPPGYEFHVATGMDGTRAKYPEKSRVTFSRNAPSGASKSSVWAPKEFKIDHDHNQFKCPWDHCTKGFRKMILLDSHLKHYHNQDGSPKPPPPPRLRKKTISVCSTDSDISVGGKSTGSRSRRQSQLSISSMPEVSQDGSMGSVDDDTPGNNESLTMQIEEKPLGLIPKEEPVPMETTGFGSQRQGNKDEVVNCICQINEENGLMIQCEVCLCWQHAMCMEITEETLPRKYICYICQHPPGVRENARYMHVQDWHREGVMPCYGFLPPVPENERRSPSVVQGTHDLVGDMHNVHRVLYALRKELHSVNNRDQSELQLWTKNWDREAKCTSTEVKMETSGVKLESTDTTPKVAAQGRVKLEGKEFMGYSNELDSMTIKAENDEDKQKLLDSIRSRFNFDDDPVGSDRADDDTDEERTEDGEKEESGETTDEAEETLRHEAALREQELREQAGLSQSSSATELHDYFGSAELKQSSLSAARKALSAIGRVASSESTDDLESDVSVNQVEDDPFANCERHLLEHILMMQDNVESRMDSIEEQVAALEALTPTNHGRDVLTEVPNLKRLIHQLVTDLDKVKRMARYH